ncbi:MAG TPA: hypothetical protein DD435_03940 [Cyanobacteria bacterium UBA8530]|nr:hypothetical protein [Cyanobacteria bacterium UBA8530]
MENIQIFNRTITLEQIRMGIMGTCGALCLWMLYSQTFPKVQDYLGKRAENELKRKEIEEMKRGTRNMAQLQFDLTRVRHNLAKVRDRFPPKAQILSTLLVDLADIFRQCDCELSNFGPGEPQPLNTGAAGEITRDLSLLPVQITARGSYSALITLFVRLSKYERVLDMQELTLTPEGGDGFSNKLGIQFTLTTYVLNR